MLHPDFVTQTKTKTIPSLHSPPLFIPSHVKREAAVCSGYKNSQAFCSSHPELAKHPPCGLCFPTMSPPLTSESFLQGSLSCFGSETSVTMGFPPVLGWVTGAWNVFWWPRCLPNARWSLHSLSSPIWCKILFIFGIIIIIKKYSLCLHFFLHVPEEKL